VIIVQHGEILNYFLPNPCRKSRTSDSIRVLVLVAAHVASYNIQVRRLMPRQVLALPEPVEGRKVGVRKLSDAVQLPLAFYLVALRIQPCKRIKTDGADPCVLVLDQRADHGRSCPDPGSEKRRGIRLGRPGLESLRRAGGCQYTGREGSVAEMQEGLAEEMMPGTKTTACFFRISADLKGGWPTVEPFSTGRDEFREVEVAERGHVREQGLEVPRGERVEVEILQRRERVSRRGKVPAVVAPVSGDEHSQQFRVGDKETLRRLTWRASRRGLRG
jgi:hypothetical protein